MQLEEIRRGPATRCFSAGRGLAHGEGKWDLKEGERDERNVAKEGSC